VPARSRQLLVMFFLRSHAPMKIIQLNYGSILPE
jgi:hypothetical protein